MSEHTNNRQSAVIGPEGSVLRTQDLPPPGTKRWVIRRMSVVKTFGTSARVF